MAGGLRIAAVTGAASGLTDPILAELADRLTAEGLRVSGAVQRTTPSSALRNKTMELVLLPDRRVVTISEERPPGAPGCSLDPGVFETVAAEVAARIAPGADVAILSKFGQREIEGQGLRAAIVAAVEHDLPLLIGVAPARVAAFEAFVGGPVTCLPAAVPPLQRWVRDNLGQLA
ncbi:DUF2478 domain-containing protein [Palleronia sp. KMU-117]|uniref:DUF2478 domain-containing protein n=1 Tax=Palleronia sp. KMU-117 TaxID=3434108 RepID=UPI003D7630EC